ncbi:MAG TPA: histidine--tRNA ligase [Ignisphaera sp.]|uniref:Histidine--tRNA ligase n=1 Tax=Ignisphaera aggregans TaxID=334771 RepID=A0A832Z0P9_9CREN|nr:histidine--tRNA ligase [Ignisphaera sp.]HIP57241.1 histidine--tRNA ligase [Ignisphaera aggregans]
MVKIQLDPVRGMRDYVPPESEELTWICEEFRRVVERFGYREVRTPTIERFELFALKSGQEIRESMYVFRDKAGREVALRPEVTPSVIRLYLKELNAWPKPLKLYYIANVFRYDEPQYGRYREFTQAGVEILGADALTYDVELIMLLEEFYDSIGLKNREYKVNNIGIVRRISALAGLTENDAEKFLHLLDKEMFDEAIKLVTSRGTMKAGEILRELLKYRDMRSVDHIVKVSEMMPPDIAEELHVLVKYLEYLDSLGVRYRVDLAFARGIAYYTGIIFEVRVPGIPISIAGGGRYDDLTVVYGGPQLSSTGFAIGVERTLLALKSLGGGHRQRLKRVLVVIMIDEPKVYVEIAKRLRMLRERCFVTQIEVSTKLNKLLQYANKFDFDYVMIVGKREVEQGVVTIKDLRRWHQMEVPLNKVEEVMRCGGG